MCSMWFFALDSSRLTNGAPTVGVAVQIMVHGLPFAYDNMMLRDMFKVGFGCCLVFGFKCLSSPLCS